MLLKAVAGGLKTLNERDISVSRLGADKVDRSFITDLVENSEARAVTGAIIDLCANPNLEGIVEGVERYKVSNSVTH